jgi:hypothetical protein
LTEDAAARRVSSAARSPLDFERIVVIGGGCYGSWYTQQLTRAMARGALVARDIVVVDRHADCQVAERVAAGVYAGAPVRVVESTWADYLAEWLSIGAAGLRGHAMVPSPLMPHLCFDWLLARARQRWPSRDVRVEALDTTPPTPWERGAPDGRHYVSFATWTCPVNCIEPATCPATRGPREWSMPDAMRRFAAGEPGLGRSVIFHCEHRTYGVGMIDADVIATADQHVAEWGASHPVRVLVGTVSHCHGALGVLAVA